MSARLALGVSAGGVAFCLVAIMNSGGYRYGIGDQAFYVPAIVQHADPMLFPRDRGLLHVQDQLMLFDDLAGVVTQRTGASLATLFFVSYLCTMGLLFAALVSLGRATYRSWWTVALLAALMTLRHRITETGANTLEPYFHPRTMAFALGVGGIAACLRGRAGLALVLAAVALLVHPTTAIWFGIWIAVAAWVSEKRWRVPLASLAAATTAAAIWMIVAGPLRGHLTRIDPVWASVLEGKDYVFPSDWGPAFFVVNFGYLAAILAGYALRRRRGLTSPREAGLVAGAAALVVLFLLSWPLMSGGLALAVQLQTSRIFWMLDLLAAVYVAWLLAEATPARLRRGIVLGVVAAAAARGVYVMAVEHPGAPVIQVGLPPDSWNDAMLWVSRTPTGSHVLADPGHAWKYGTSVRVSGRRDVFLEEVKDASVALYSRDVAMRVLDRIQNGRQADAWTAPAIRDLAARYQLDYLVVDRDIDLPLVYSNDRFRVYDLHVR